MTFYVEVTLEGQSEAILSAFEKAAVARHEVLECHLMTGPAACQPHSVQLGYENCKTLDRLSRALTLPDKAFFNDKFCRLGI